MATKPPGAALRAQLRERILRGARQTRPQPRNSLYAGFWLSSQNG